MSLFLFLSRSFCRIVNFILLWEELKAKTETPLGASPPAEFLLPLWIRLAGDILHPTTQTERNGHPAYLRWCKLEVQHANIFTGRHCIHLAVESKTLYNIVTFPITGLQLGSELLEILNDWMWNGFLQMFSIPVHSNQTRSFKRWLH